MSNGARVRFGLVAAAVATMTAAAGAGAARGEDAVAATGAAAPREARADVETRGVPPRERLREAFARARREQVPTGILLEKGGLGGAHLVRAHDGGGRAKPLTRLGFANAWGDLVAAEVSRVLPDRRGLDRAGRLWRERLGATPIGLAVVDYDTLVERERIEAAPARGGALRLPAGRLGETRRFVAAVVEAEAVYRFNPRLVVASALFASNVASPSRVGRLSVRVGEGPLQRVAFDVPFVPAVLPERNGRHEVAVSFALDGTTHVARAVFRLEGEGRGLRLPVPAGTSTPCVGGVIHVGGATVRYYDLPPVTARIPHRDPLDPPGETPYGTVNVRVYPAGGTVEELGGGRCRVRLVEPLVAVDGFDYSNTRTQESIWNDFGAALRRFLLWGFDVVTVDYADGRDWIERNGYAVRELLVNGLEEIVDPAVLSADRVVVVGGSMGTQTVRWALRGAEQGGEDHNTGLFVAVDGPFRGANIPISLHAALDWGAEVFAGLDGFLEGLDSRAAIQQLRRTRYTDAAGRRVWYRQHPRGAAYFGAVDAPGFGLPRRTRNVAIASGSGTGSLQNDGSVRRMVYTHPSLWKSILGAQFGVKAYAKTDFAASSPIYDLFPSLRPPVFDGVADDRILFGLIDLGLIPGGVRKLRVALSGADYLDVAPGGYRASPRELLEAAADLGLEGKLLSDLEVHGFIPTFSALGVATGDMHYNPSRDPAVAARVPFDSFFWEKCNRGHVEITDDALGFLKRELEAFRGGTEPPAPALFAAACSRPEPRELCLGLVTWLADPVRPVDIEPWDDGANCYVAPVPAGLTGRVAGDAYYVDAVGGACPVGVPEPAGGSLRCRLGRAPRGRHPSSTPGASTTTARTSEREGPAQAASVVRSARRLSSTWPCSVTPIVIASTRPWPRT
jgi:hypothetical protein